MLVADIESEGKQLSNSEETPMGFTFDMVSGEILEESTQLPKKQGSERTSQTEMTEFEVTEPTLLISESLIEPVTEVSMPEGITQTDIDSFLDKFNE